MSRAQRARARHAAARDLRSRAAHAPVGTDRDELVSLLSAGDDDERHELTASTLRTHGLVTEPALLGVDPGTPLLLRRTGALAVQGAVIAGIAATAFGTARLWIYGLLFALATLLAAGLLLARADLADRLVPDAVPRGRWAGAVLAATLVAAVGILVAVPVYSARRGWL
jgi:hypothetical protein